jgi:hypothetical protein
MAAEKARFYLEKSMPELREYEKKKIFTRVRTYLPGSSLTLLALLSSCRAAAHAQFRKKLPPLLRSVPTLSTVSMPPVAPLTTSPAMSNTK